MSSSAIEWEPSCDFAVTNDGTHVALLGQDGGVRIVDVKTGQVLLELDSHNTLIRDLAFSSDGRRLAAATEWSPGRADDAPLDGFVRKLWRCPVGDRQQRPAAHCPPAAHMPANY